MTPESIEKRTAVIRNLKRAARDDSAWRVTLIEMVEEMHKEHITLYNTCLHLVRDVKELKRTTV